MNKKYRAWPAAAAWWPASAAATRCWAFSLHDPDGVEGPVQDIDGLGLLPVKTSFAGEKRTCLTRGRLHAQMGFWNELQERDLSGYEIHCGQSVLMPGHEALMSYTDAAGGEVEDGAASFDGRVFGAHLHGFFDNTHLLQLVINTLRSDRNLPPLDLKELPSSQREQNYNHLADIVEQSLDMQRLRQIMDLAPNII